jgi:hypothetical protein
MNFIEKHEYGILKIDFEIAYDKVNWSFLQQDFCMKGSDPKRSHRVNEYIG